MTPPKHAAGGKPGRALAEPENKPAPEGATCARCGEWKPRAEFCVCVAKRNGLKSWCRDCDAANFAARYATPEGRAAGILNSHKTRSQGAESFYNTVSEAWVVRRLSQGCPYFGTPFRPSGTGPGPDSPTLDHFVPGDNSADNAWLISKRANQIKSDGTPEEILQVALVTHIIRNFNHTLTQAQFTGLRDSLNAEVRELIERRMQSFRKQMNLTR